MDRRLALSTLLFAAANVFGDERKEIANSKATGTEPQAEGMGSLSSRDSDQWQKQTETESDGVSDRSASPEFVRPRGSGAL